MDMFGYKIDEFGDVKKLFHWIWVWLNVLEAGVILNISVIVLHIFVSMIVLFNYTFTDDWKEQILGEPLQEK